MATYISVALCWMAWNEPMGTPELLSALGVLKGQVQDALTGADHRDGQAHQRDVPGPFDQGRRCRRLEVQPVGLLDAQPVEGHFGDVQNRVEHIASPRGDAWRLCRIDDSAVDHEHPPAGVTTRSARRDRRPARTSTCPPAPSLSAPIGADPPVVDRRPPGLRRVEALSGQRRELRQRRQERGRVGRPAEFLEHDGQFDRVLRVASSVQPASR